MDNRQLLLDNIIEIKLKSKKTSLTKGKLNNDFAKGASLVCSTFLNS